MQVNLVIELMVNLDPDKLSERVDREMAIAAAKQAVETSLSSHALGDFSEPFFHSAEIVLAKPEGGVV